MKRLFLYLLIPATLIACKKEASDTTNFLFKNIPADQSGITFRNDIVEDVNHSIINYIYYYNGAGVASGDINNDGLPDLYFASNMGENKLYLNKGDLAFEDISQKANISSNSSWNTGVTMVDINNDGYLDIYLCSVSGLLDFKGRNELFVNNGDGTFTEKAKDYGLDFQGYSTQAHFFDYDKDDDLDVYIINHAVHTTLSHGPADARSKRVPFVGDVLLQNNNGNFVDVSEKANIFGGVNGYGLSASIADFNNDGWDDIYVCNDFHEDDYYYINNQDGTFSEKLDNSFSTISRFSMGSDAGDINGDGFQDLVTLDMLPKDERVLKETEGDDAMLNMQDRLKKLGYKDQYARNMLQINSDGTHFTEAALYNDIADTDWSWGALIADFNNDSHQDLFVSNGILRRPNGLDFKKYVSNAFRNRNPQDGMNWLYKSIDAMPKGKVSNEIFKGNSSTFQAKTGEWIEEKPSLSNGAIYSDLDLDGDLDIVLNNLNEPAAIYENTTNGSKNYLTVKFSYKENNKMGIGTKAILFHNNKKQIKQLFNSRGFLSSVNNELHFGINNDSIIDSLQVIWPNNYYQTFINPSINQRKIIEYAPTNDLIYSYRRASPKAYFKESNAIEFEHEEDRYNDFLARKLMPYKISAQGPAVTFGDIDGNGYDDLFIGNSSGFEAGIFLNDGENFKKMMAGDIESDKLFEDNDAVLFDADNDQDLDLYVATGIHQNRAKQYENDRLYINDNGNFKKSKDRIPANNLIASCVISYDYDNDNDEDLFIGNLADADNFGANIASYILINDGKGNFKKDKKFVLNSKVTNAVWEDINGDNQKDLLIATEWDAPKIYLNNNGAFSEMTLPDNLNGLWQSIAAFDIDKDGDKDILLGNWGLNTKFKPTPEAPLKMYHSDFNKDGATEVILAYNKNGIYYPVNSKDELASQINAISKKFVKHSDYALKSVEDVFTKAEITKAGEFNVHTLASGFLRNENGKFTAFNEFPQELQLAPINSFSHLNINDTKHVLISGNSLRVNTYHGAFTSLKGYFLENENTIKKASHFGIAKLDEQVKKSLIIKMKDAHLLVILKNNDSVKSYSYQAQE